jgi:transaldolase/glucose-6-phosphate isomerase
VRNMARECGGPAGKDNPGAWLGAVMGELARDHGRDKLTLLASPSLASFGPWVEQLIAESTGKEGTGILPVDEEPEGAPEVYGDDRLFVSMSLRGEEGNSGLLEELRDRGHPVVEIVLGDPYELGAEMFRWEVATAIAGVILGINPFNQPNVESAKVQARNMVAEYRDKGELPEPEPTVREGGSPSTPRTPRTAWARRLEASSPRPAPATTCPCRPTCRRRMGRPKPYRGCASIFRTG